MVRVRGGSERGGVAVTVALAMTVLLGFAALVVDVGLNWAARTSAQTAADSAALAGAARLLTDGPPGAVDAVRGFLNQNVAGLADQPADPGWPTNADESDGEVVCWTLPAPPPNPPPGGPANCPEGSNALQVVTPPIEVDYAFAGVLGQSSNSIKALAAAGAGPAAPNNCVLCLLEPTAPEGLLALDGGVEVDGGGIAVNSASLQALVLSGSGDVSADQIRVVGGFRDAGGGQFSPAPESGGPPVADPLADLPTPDLLADPPEPVTTPVQNITTSTILGPGVYDSITVTAGATLTLQPGVYVLRGATGLTVANNATVAGNGVTIYLACGGYPAPCSAPGATFLLASGGRFLANPPADGQYAGLSLFADRGNTQPIQQLSDPRLTLDGALYAAGAALVVDSNGGLEVNSLLVVDSLVVSDSGPVEVNYDPSVLLPGVGRPVLIR